MSLHTKKRRARYQPAVSKALFPAAVQKFSPRAGDVVCIKSKGLTGVVMEDQRDASDLVKVRIDFGNDTKYKRTDECTCLFTLEEIELAQMGRGHFVTPLCLDDHYESWIASALRHYEGREVMLGYKNIMTCQIASRLFQQLNAHGFANAHLMPYRSLIAQVGSVVSRCKSAEDFGSRRVSCIVRVFDPAFSAKKSEVMSWPTIEPRDLIDGEKTDQLVRWACSANCIASGKVSDRPVWLEDERIQAWSGLDFGQLLSVMKVMMAFSSAHFSKIRVIPGEVYPIPQVDLKAGVRCYINVENTNFKNTGGLPQLLDVVKRIRLHNEDCDRADTALKNEGAGSSTGAKTEKMMVPVAPPMPVLYPNLPAIDELGIVTRVRGALFIMPLARIEDALVAKSNLPSAMTEEGRAAKLTRETYGAWLRTMPKQTIKMGEALGADVIMANSILLSHPVVAQARPAGATA